MQKNDRRAIGGTGFGVGDIQDAGIDLLQRTERRVRSRLDCRHLALRLAGCAVAEPIMPSCAAAMVIGRGTKEAAAMHG